MAAPTYCIPKTRQRLHEILTANLLTINPARIELGRVEEEDDQEFYDDIDAAGPAINISVAEITGYERHYDNGVPVPRVKFNVKLNLYVGVVPNENYDYIDIEYLVTDITNLLSDHTLFTDNACVPSDIGFTRDDEISQSPRVILYTVTMSFDGLL